MLIWQVDAMLSPANDHGAHAAAEAVAPRSVGKPIAYLPAQSRDVAAAEDALSEAFPSALAVWTQQVCPNNPEAWLIIAARRKLIDQLRRKRKTPNTDEQERLADAIIAAADDDLPDRRLALLFACVHPSIDLAMDAPLILHVVLGLEAA